MPPVTVKLARFLHNSRRAVMKSFVFRGFALSLVLLLAACQSAPQPANLPVDDLVSAFRQLDQSLASGDLSSAESQLGSLQQRAAGDTRLEQYLSANSPKRTCNRARKPCKAGIWITPPRL